MITWQPWFEEEEELFADNKYYFTETVFLDNAPPPRDSSYYIQSPSIIDLYQPDINKDGPTWFLLYPSLVGFHCSEFPHLQCHVYIQHLFYYYVELMLILVGNVELWICDKKKIRFFSLFCHLDITRNNDTYVCHSVLQKLLL
jgi:hypothetical protein